MQIEINDDTYSKLTDLTKDLDMTMEELIRLSTSHFLHSDTFEAVHEGMARIKDEELLVDFPELKEEIGLDIKFHPLAMEELDSLTETEQVEILEAFIQHITEEDEEQEDIDLILKETADEQTLLSEFDFGQVVYQLGEIIRVYHIAIPEELDELDDPEKDEEDDDEDAHESEEDEFDQGFEREEDYDETSDETQQNMHFIKAKTLN